jgi:hypothetical protein
MKRTLLPLFGSALAWLLFAGTQARADFVNWSYSWSRSPSVITADGTGTGKVFLTPVSGSAQDTSDIGAVNITTSSTASAGNPDTFTNKAYSLTIKLTDDASHATGSLTFTGLLNGSISATSSNLMTTFLAPLSQSLTLGQNLYTVSLNVPAGSSATLGGIGAHVVVEPAKVSSTPEPSGLVLAGLAVPCLGLGLCWQRYRRRTAV